jgi:hypothetical protein
MQFSELSASVGLSHGDSLALLEEGLVRVFRGFVTSRFTTFCSVTTGGKRGDKRSFVHLTPDEEGSSTLLMLEAALHHVPS